MKITEIVVRSYALMFAQVISKPAARKGFIISFSRGLVRKKDFTLSCIDPGMKKSFLDFAWLIRVGYFGLFLLQRPIPLSVSVSYFDSDRLREYLLQRLGNNSFFYSFLKR